MNARTALRRGRRGRRDRQRRLGRPRRPGHGRAWSPRPGVHYVVMHWRGRRGCRCPTTATSSPRCARELKARDRRAGRRRAWSPSGSSSTRASASRKTAEHNWAAARPARRARHARPPRAGRRLAQAVPRRAAPRRRAAGDARRADRDRSARSPRGRARGRVRVHDVAVDPAAPSTSGSAGKPEAAPMTARDEITLTGLRAIALPRRLRRASGATVRSSSIDVTCCTCRSPRLPRATTSSAPCTTASSPSEVVARGRDATRST